MRIPGNVTHTYAELEVSQATWDEIASLLNEADYSHAFHEEGRVIDMHGIGLTKKQAKMPSLINFYVNNNLFKEFKTTINYNEIVAYSGLKGNPTVIYSFITEKGEATSGMLTKDSDLFNIIDGMSFTVVHTNNA